MLVYEVLEGLEVYGVKSWGYKASERLLSWEEKGRSPRRTDDR